MDTNNSSENSYSQTVGKNISNTNSITERKNKFSAFFSNKDNLLIIIILFLASDFALYSIYLPIFFWRNPSLSGYNPLIYSLIFIFELFILTVFGINISKNKKLKDNDNKINENYNSPITVPEINDPNNKMRHMYIFFIFINLSLYIGSVFLVVTEMNRICYEMGCVIILPFLFVVAPIFGIFLYGIIKVIYNHSEDKSVTNNNEIEYSKTFKSYLMLTLLMFFVFMGILVSNINQITYDKKMLEQSIKKQIAYTKANPWIARDKQRDKDLDLISQDILAFRAKYAKLPESLEVLRKDGYKIPLDPLTKNSYKYLSNDKNGNFVVCVEKERNLGNEKEINCEHNGQYLLNYIEYKGLEITLNKGNSSLTCFCSNITRLYVCVKVDCSSVQEQITDCNDYCKYYGGTNTLKTPECISNAENCVNSIKLF